MSGARDPEAARPMTDERLERELQAILHGRHPGPAPLTLRERVLDVPDRDARRGGRNLSAVARPLLGLAATVALLAGGAWLVASLGGHGLQGPAASPPSPAPATTFDPTLTGPGVAPTVASAWLPWVDLLVVVVLIVLALVLRSWRRLVPVAGAVGCLGFAVFATQVPVEVGTFGYGPGLNVIEARMPPGAETTVLYETAQPGQPFSFPLFLTIHASVPVRIEGLDQPTTGVQNGPGPTALWTDAEPTGGRRGPGRPFEAVEVSDWIQTLWVVGIAGSCAAGLPVDPANPPTDFGFTVIDSLNLRASVLGWPRTLQVALPFRLVELQRTEPCVPGVQASPGAPPASIPGVTGSPTG
jgi:hypothetical protein